MFESLLDQDTAYVIGLLQTDGHHAGSPDAKGKVSIELSIRDADVLHAIAERLPCYSSVQARTRTTNFAQQYQSCVLGFFDQGVRRRLVEFGVPAGR